jgi:hypothetical protein
VSARRTTWLLVVAVLGCMLVPIGALLVWSGVDGDHGGRTVVGILLGLLGLVCLWVLWWVRRVRRMTQAGMAFRADESERRDGG